ncbi:tannase/feruloyl esterase family alpha/beta hydrolase [Methylobacterium nonmethylotrophicum]|uniref:Tannase/feruloyl esterase family alpha/beta hydrolase n=1 Tax=Methylobacterium nonmethylotrophicum TaxID=1141884 RepID=A0A4Z0NVM4_9HYPH|nr:tannase/feruloyl esterase family alpha/beta hydrolase [Methylobacterium nonmethylotrophicum]TGE01761.1 tannase/feruloyl esterase family alpha/beta hydrolase [Methylobacterium nonmethylotrophicum]
MARHVTRGAVLTRPIVGLSAILAGPALADPLACGDIASLARPDLRIARAEAVPAGTLPSDNPGRAALTGAARAKAALPAHCLVEGTIDPRVGAGGVAYGIGFQLRLPEAWNGRFLFQGGGGLDGVVGEALGAIPVSGATAPPALLRGYAVVSTDSGHRGRDSSDASFGLDQQARVDFAYGAVGAVAREARALVTARYGRAPAHAYFMGCSNGGRSALMAATRFPTAFDGIVAAALNDPTGTFLSTFTAKGGRLLVYQGVADPVFSARDLAAHWQDLARHNGGGAALADWARLFLVPGMTHCGGGPALDDFDPLTALEAWVERGEAPDRIAARGAAFPGRTRPLCPFPQEARYQGGEADRAESFACRAP